jgi:hypothetical protein
MNKPDQPRSYVVQTIVKASSAEEAIRQAKLLPATSVFLENPQPDSRPITDAIGYKFVE